MNIYTSSKYAIEGLSEETAVIGRFFNIWFVYRTLLFPNEYNKFKCNRFSFKER